MRRASLSSMSSYDSAHNQTVCTHIIGSPQTCCSRTSGLPCIEVGHGPTKKSERWGASASPRKTSTGSTWSGPERCA